MRKVNKLVALVASALLALNSWGLSKKSLADSIYSFMNLIPGPLAEARDYRTSNLTFQGQTPTRRIILIAYKNRGSPDFDDAVGGLDNIFPDAKGEADGFMNTAQYFGLFEGEIPDGFVAGVDSDDQDTNIDAFIRIYDHGEYIGFRPDTASPEYFSEDQIIWGGFTPFGQNENEMHYIQYIDIENENVIPGDATLDWKVDYLDLGILATNYSTAGDWWKGDFNHDAIVDYQDLGKLATNYGYGGSLGRSASSNNSVPEPAILTLLGIGGIVAVSSRFKSKRK